MQTDSLLPPLVPADVDLRNFPTTPILRSRLFGSYFHAHASDSEWRAGVTLWLKSWEQLPAGTLPNDDAVLCRLAELGRDLDTWAAVKDMALHGFVLCSDGRLHHPVIAEIVMEAWDKKRYARNRKRTWREQTATSPTCPGPVPGTSRGRPGQVPVEEKRREDSPIRGSETQSEDTVSPSEVGVIAGKGLSKGPHANVVALEALQLKRDV